MMKHAYFLTVIDSVFCMYTINRFETHHMLYRSEIMNGYRTPVIVLRGKRST